MKLWRLRTHAPFIPSSEPKTQGDLIVSDVPPDCLRDWSARLGVPPLVVDLLWQRGLRSLEEMDIFLDPGLRYLSRPEEWSGLSQAVELLDQAIAEGKDVLIWGDYDVDGITGATLLHEVLAFHDVPVRVHLPDRSEDGYGLYIPVLERLAGDGIGVLLTVDCGIADVEAVAKAKELGFIVILTDHHLPHAELPDADGVVNPRLGDNPCPFLCGVGVAFFFMAALNRRLSARTGKSLDMREVLDLVALGTLADMVSLKGQNRILAKNGLLKIAEAKRIGLAELKVASGFSPGATLGSSQVVFTLAPRINAAGRLGSPLAAHALLCCQEHEEASKLARSLNDLNITRRAEEDRICAEAMAQAAEFSEAPGLVLYGQDWHQGVIGIVASRILEVYFKPVLILCFDGKSLKGSGRSIPEFDLHAGLTQCADLLERFGGHSQAAGFQLSPSLLEAFRQRFYEAITTQLGDTTPQPTLLVDGELSFTQASDFITLKALELLQPFGMDNPEPVFVSLPLVVRNRRLFGQKKEHVSLYLTEEASGITLKSNFWKQAEQIPASIQGRRIRLAYTPEINAYDGVASVELRVRDWEFL